ncbi:hypothetical protein ONE63_011223 [Megalurothrips usitatus]|uniref:Cr1-8 nvi n=1 Tax=Megalurothrips usitatus TaxID=439358 RepID=A0AAV7X3F8_9NEOP|nr:hypothetical protein ONE63_011223 [Megalurothrips usitatus]
MDGNYSDSSSSSAIRGEADERSQSALGCLDDNYSDPSSSNTSSNSSTHGEPDEWSWSEESNSTSSSSSHDLNNHVEQERQDNDISEQERDGGAFSRLRSEVPKLQEKMNLNVKISVGEILTNALTLVRKHNWSHLEKENLMKFATSILNCGNILPNSRYLLDEYFYSQNDMWYYFYCSECTKHLGSVPACRSRPEQICCPNPECKTVNRLHDLSKANYFVTFDLPSQIEVLLSDPDIRCKLVNPSDYTEPSEGGVMTDLHHGTMYREFANFIKNEAFPPNIRVISFTISIDSARLCQTFSGQSICPAFIMINELPQVHRIGNPLIAGLWFGTTKEKLDLFLPPIVKHVISLSTRGFTLHFLDEMWFLKGFLIACVADSVARCDVQGLHSHRGDYPCSWCLIEGEEWEGVRIFRFTPEIPPPRTLEELVEDAGEALRTKQFIRGVKYLCPLAPAPFFHSVNSFIVDSMHAKDEGTSKSFLSAWLGEFGHRAAFSVVAKTKTIDKRLKSTRPPKEFRKSIRKLDDLAYWTGRELDNWAMYLSIPILNGILPPRFLKHWALYVQANFILLNTELPVDAIDIAEELLEQFCFQVETLYPLNMMRFNLHILRHFPANSRRWGQMFALSAYGFEAGNQKLKKLVHNANYIPNQICRGLSESNSLILMKRYCESTNTRAFEEEIDRKKRRFAIELEGNIRLLHKGKRFHATEEEEWFLRRMGKTGSEFLVFTELKKNGCHYGADVKKQKTNNSFVCLANYDIVNIKKFLYCEASREVFVIGVKVRYEPSSLCPPSVVRFDRRLCFLFQVTSIDEDIIIFSVKDFRTVCVSIELENGHFISPMSNLYNMF